ncbi:MAG: GNAT family N-acyltransferase [Pseudomonadota bacterium]
MPMDHRSLFARLRPRGTSRSISAVEAGRRTRQRFATMSAYFRRSPSKIYGKIGSLEVRLASTKQDVRRAQRLRYKVFYEEMSAKPSLAAQLSRRDEDRYDRVCDHLLVVDTDQEAAGQQWSQLGRRTSPRVVGTYRILRGDKIDSAEAFYSQGEYDIAPMVRSHGDSLKFMEVGRSCVLQPYRNKRTVELLWHGLWTYTREHKVGVMMGCASFEGVDPDAHAEALSFLYHERLAPPEWRVRAHADQHVEMARLPKDQVSAKAALKGLPPLIKGYLRLGAYVGDGAVIDHQFCTTDVFIILPVAAIDPRYFEHFGSPEEVGSRVAV